MAALTGPVVQAYGGGGGQPRWAVMSFQKVTAGDTFDMSTLAAIAPFQTVITGEAVAVSNRTETFALAGVAGTVVTLAGTGIANDSVDLWVVGT